MMGACQSCCPGSDEDEGVSRYKRNDKKRPRQAHNTSKNHKVKKTDKKGRCCCCHRSVCICINGDLSDTTTTTASGESSSDVEMGKMNFDTLTQKYNEKQHESNERLQHEQQLAQESTQSLLYQLHTKFTLRSYPLSRSPHDFHNFFTTQQHIVLTPEVMELIQWGKKGTWMNMVTGIISAHPPPRHSCVDPLRTIPMRFELIQVPGEYLPSIEEIDRVCMVNGTDIATTTPDSNNNNTSNNDDVTSQSLTTTATTLTTPNNTQTHNTNNNTRNIDKIDQRRRKYTYKDLFLRDFGINLTFITEPINDEVYGNSITAITPSTYSALFYVQFLYKELKLYPRSFLEKAGLKNIVLCEELHYKKQVRKAIPVVNSNLLYLDVCIEPVYYMQGVLHHEFFHLFDDKILFEMKKPINNPISFYNLESGGAKSLPLRLNQWLLNNGSRILEHKMAPKVNHHLTSIQNDDEKSTITTTVTNTTTTTTTNTSPNQDVTSQDTKDTSNTQNDNDNVNNSNDVVVIHINDDFDATNTVSDDVVISIDIDDAATTPSSISNIITTPNPNTSQTDQNTNQTTTTNIDIKDNINTQDIDPESFRNPTITQTIDPFMLFSVYFVMEYISRHTMVFRSNVVPTIVKHYLEQKEKYLKRSQHDNGQQQQQQDGKRISKKSKKKVKTVADNLTPKTITNKLLSMLVNLFHLEPYFFRSFPAVLHLFKHPNYVEQQEKISKRGSKYQNDEPIDHIPPFPPPLSILTSTPSPTEPPVLLNTMVSTQTKPPIEHLHQYFSQPPVFLLRPQFHQGVIKHYENELSNAKHANSIANLDNIHSNEFIMKQEAIEITDYPPTTVSIHDLFHSCLSNYSRGTLYSTYFRTIAVSDYIPYEFNYPLFPHRQWLYQQNNLPLPTTAPVNFLPYTFYTSDPNEPYNRDNFDIIPPIESYQFIFYSNCKAECARMKKDPNSFPPSQLPPEWHAPHLPLRVESVGSDPLWLMLNYKGFKYGPGGSNWRDAGASVTLQKGKFDAPQQNGRNNNDNTIDVGVNYDNNSNNNNNMKNNKRHRGNNIDDEFNDTTGDDLVSLSNYNPYHANNQNDINNNNSNSDHNHHHHHDETDCANEFDQPSVSHRRCSISTNTNETQRDSFSLLHNHHNCSFSKIDAPNQRNVVMDKDAGIGFLNTYSMSAIEEDKAEVYSWLIRNPAAILNSPDHYIRAKGMELWRRLELFCPDVNADFLTRLLIHQPVKIPTTDWSFQHDPRGYSNWCNDVTGQVLWIDPDLLLAEMLLFHDQYDIVKKAKDDMMVVVDEQTHILAERKQRIDEQKSIEKRQQQLEQQRRAQLEEQRQQQLHYQQQQRQQQLHYQQQRQQQHYQQQQFEQRFQQQQQQQQQQYDRQQRLKQEQRRQYQQQQQQHAMYQPNYEDEQY